MRLYLSVDMEGLAGVAHAHQVTFGPGVDRTDYDRSRGLMAAETNAAIRAAHDAGADEVMVNDSHWQMRNLRAEDLDPRARLVTGDKPLSMTEGVDDGPFDGALFIGYHAGANHPTGVIAHTYSSATILEARVNGEPHNEAALNAIRLGHHGIPVILVAGDDALAGEVEERLPWAERVVVKRARGYSAADSLAPDVAAAAIAAGVARAIGRLPEMRAYRPDAPLRAEIEFRLPVMADYAAVLPAVARVGGRSVTFDAPDGEHLYRTFLAVQRLAATPAV
jgi:D-amino peptidase